MRTQGRLEAQNQQIASNAVTQVPTMTRSELAMCYHQSLGTPRKDALLTKGRQEIPRLICDLPRIDMGPYQESPTAIESDRERTHDYDTKKV